MLARIYARHSADYESINATGAIMGSGMVVTDEDTCIVDFAVALTSSRTSPASAFCRIGRRGCWKSWSGFAKARKIEDLIAKDLSQSQGRVPCALGGTAPNPSRQLSSTSVTIHRAHRRQEMPGQGLHSPYPLHHRRQARVPCARECPVKAISGEIKKPHLIDQDLCIKCGRCMAVCPVKAISVE